MSSAHKNIITSYLGDVAKASGKTQNVYSVANEYFGNNGQIQYSAGRVVRPVRSSTR